MKRESQSTASVRRILATNTGLPILALLLVGALLGWLFVQIQGQQQAIARAEHVRRQLSRADALLARMESGQRGYLITGSPTFARPFYDARTAAHASFQALGAMTARDPELAPGLRQIQALEQRWEQNALHEMALRGAGDPGLLPYFRTGTGATMMADLHTRLDGLRDVEIARQAGREARLQRQSTLAMTVGGLGLLATILFFGMFSIRQYRQLIESNERTNQSLQEANVHLEARVAERTRELEAANKGLKQFELLVRSVSDYAIIMLDPEGRIVSWNKGAERLKGYKQAEILGKSMQVFYPAADVAAGKPQRLLKEAEQQGHVQDEGWRVRKDGSLFWADVVFTALHDDQGQLVGYAKVTRDLSERKQAEELALTAAQLQASNQLKNEFLANMSHELRTPLNSIIGYTELVLTDEEQPLDELNQHNLETVIKNAKHLLSLINDILDISKIEAGKLSVYPEPFNPRDTLQAVVAMAEPLAKEKGLYLRTRIEPGVELAVSDERKVRQIVLNLVSNAIKFTNQGGVEVRLAPRGSDRFQVIVQDTGIGIAPEHRQLVFEEFRQVDATTTRQAGGTGLGLAISRKLARLLGGDLTLESTQGEGSAFTLELPRQAAAAPVPASTMPVTFLPTTVNGERPIVLAVDDNPEVLYLLAEKLKATPYQVVTATSGESGLRLARELHPYAITLDVMMPGMDGWMMLRELKADPATRDIPVVILSFIENKAVAFSLGAAGYLSKPIDREELRHALDRLCGDSLACRGHVLVVDDDPEARHLYRQILDREHVQVQEAVDGRQALEAIEHDPPLLVILDLMMPHVDGFEVLAHMRANPATRDIPVIVVTAKKLTPDDVARLSAAHRIISKGGSISEQLVSDLETVLTDLGAPHLTGRSSSVGGEA